MNTQQRVGKKLKAAGTKQKAKRRKAPKPYRSDRYDIGSMTVDPGYTYVIEVSDDPDHLLMVSRELGPMFPSDLFGEIGYWPENELWSGSGCKLGELLNALVRETDLDAADVYRPVIEYFADELHEINIIAYFAAEENTPETKSAVLWKRWPDLHGCHELVGIVSPQLGASLSYNAIRLEYEDAIWTVSYYGDSDNEIWRPDVYYADSLDELVSPVGFTVPWDSGELAGILVDHDSNWIDYVGEENI